MPSYPYKITIKQEAQQLVGQAKRRATQIRPKAIGDGIFDRFSNFDKSRLEVASGVISSRLMGPDVPDNRVKFVHPRNNLSREIAPEAV